MKRDRVQATAEPFRAASGGRIDRSARLSFSFDGAKYAGHPGDTLASALLANGTHLVGRSFKYHRPRGILTAGSAEPNALVTVRRDWRRVTPNQRATEVELYDGLVADSQNRWPSLKRDLGSINDLMAPMLPAGFYYKTFMGPRWIGLGSNGAWSRLYEPLIRRMAGLGRTPVEADPDSYASRYAHCDVLVVGAGPAGIAAALAAAEAGASVILADEQAELGGSLLAETEGTIDGVAVWEWLANSVARLAGKSKVRLLPRTTVFGAYPGRMMGLAERISDHLDEPDPALPRERLWQVRAKEIVLATGALERPMVFAGNDRPGIMLAGAASTYLHRYGVLAGTRAVVVTTTDDAYRIATDLAGHGIGIECLVDTRATAGAEPAAAARAAGVRVLNHCNILGTQGRHRVSGVTIAHGEVLREQVDCDLVLMSGGMTPTLHLYSQLNGRLTWDDRFRTFVASGHLDGVHLAGACGGATPTMASALHSGFAAGESAAVALGLSAASRTPRSLSEPSAPEPVETAPAALAVVGKGPAFVDFQNDVTTKDIEIAAREGFRSVEHLKRYTTIGMATDQGKTSNVNALSVLAASIGAPIREIGHTTFRPPYTPVTFGTLAGECRGSLFDPVRRTPIDPSARSRGAVFENVGQWQRARYFPRPGEEMHAAVARECTTVRGAVGVFDGSTLGKIEVVGPDAAAFLDLMYVNNVASLAVGRSRYAVMLSEAGFILDDGIVARLAPDRFHLTTTTGGAARVLAHMEDYLQTEFTHLRCWLTSITEQWGVIAVQGPRSREVLAPLVEALDITPTAMPHMSQAEGRILGVPMRLFRVSFTGELGYEVNVPAGFARAVWDEVLSRVEPLGGAPYGTEAMHVLRAEKGYIIVGQESDGTVTPRDLGLPTGTSKGDFVGKRGMARPDLIKDDRPALVGLECLDELGPLEEGAQLCQRPDPPPGTPASGYVTSAYFSPTLRRPIALALVNAGRRRLGETLFVPMPRGARKVRIVAPVFVDPEGRRLHE